MDVFPPQKKKVWARVGMMECNWKNR